jgi:hypothetical protein
MCFLQNVCSIHVCSLPTHTCSKTTEATGKTGRQVRRTWHKFSKVIAYFLHCIKALQRVLFENVCPRTECTGAALTRSTSSAP